MNDCCLYRMIGRGDKKQGGDDSRPAPIVRLFVFLALAVLLTPVPSSGLEPDEILVVANGRQSLELAKYYMEKRNIPSENLFTVRLAEREHCSRDEYERNVRAPVREHLLKRDSRKAIRCLLLMYGVPLAVSGADLSLSDKARIRQLQMESRALEIRLKTMKSDEESEKKLKESLKNIQSEIVKFDRSDESASLDSEIALVLEDSYPLPGWVLNPMFVGFRGNKNVSFPQKALMVSRLDGPSEAVVRKMIDDSLTAEAEGLKGKAYFDARWTAPRSEGLSGLALYDASVHRAADRVRKSGLLPVVLDDKEKLFQPGDCPDAALYCGWYSLARYVPAFVWAKGAVGYHIASQECETLKRKESKAWCKSMLENGAAATIGPVGEPYVQAFPPPELFFDALLKGDRSLAECYAATNPFWSWRMALIGDPLYKPFKRNGR